MSKNFTGRTRRLQRLTALSGKLLDERVSYSVSPSPTPTSSLTPTPSLTEGYIPSPTPTATLTPTPSLTEGYIPSPTPTATLTPTPNHILEKSELCLQIDSYLKDQVLGSLSDNPTLEKAEVCLGINAKLTDAVDGALPTTKEIVANLCLGINAKLTDNGGLLGQGNPAMKDVSNVCLGINAELTDNGGLLGQGNPAMEDVSNVCLGINAELTDTVSGTIPTTKDVVANVCLGINAELTDTVSGTIPTTKDVVANVCLGINAELTDTVSGTIPTTKDVVANVCLGIDAKLTDTVSGTIPTTKDVVANVCLGIDAKLTDTVSAATTLDDITENPAVCTNLFGYTTDYQGISKYWGATTTIPSNGAWLFFAPTGITGTNNTGDYVVLTDTTVLLRQWDTNSAAFSSVSMEAFLDKRLPSAGPADRCTKIDRNVFSTIGMDEYTLTFEQGAGQTSTSIGAFFLHPVNQGTLTSVIDDQETEYSVYPLGGKVELTNPAGKIVVNTVEMRLYRLLPPQASSTPSVKIRLQS